MRRLKHPIRIGLGFFFLILGIIGLLVPLMPQTIFLVLALLLLFPSHPRVEKLMKKVHARWPRAAHILQRLGVGEEPASPESHRRSL